MTRPIFLADNQIGLFCKNCGKPLGQLPKAAPHKVFCCSKCRFEWHERIKQGLRRMGR